MKTIVRIVLVGALLMASSAAGPVFGASKRMDCERACLATYHAWNLQSNEPLAKSCVQRTGDLTTCRMASDHRADEYERGPYRNCESNCAQRFPVGGER